MPRTDTPDARPPLRRLLVVATAFEAVTRIQRALAGEYAVVRCASVEEARTELAGAPVAGMLAEPRDARGAPTALLVRAVREATRRGRGPAAPVIALMRRDAPWCPATVALLEARPELLLLAEDLDLASVMRTLTTRLGEAEFVRAVWGELEADVPVALRPLVRVALAQAARPLRVEALAADLGLHRKTLWARCRRHGVSSVQALMTWCRLLAAEHALRTCARPVEAVAEELAFASSTALRNAVRRHLRTTPSALREADGPRLACEGFRAWIREGTPPQETLGDVA